MTRRSPFRTTAAAIAAVAALAVVSACHVDFVPRAEARDEWRKTYTVSPTGELAIDNTNGKIVVRPGSGDTVEIVATRIAKAGTDEAAKKLLADTKIEETVTTDAVRLSSKVGIRLGGVQYQVDYEVRAPAGMRLNLSATNGAIDVDEWEGRVEMSATNGSLEGRGLRGEVDASSTNGRIELRLAALAGRGVTAETTNGRVSIEIPRDAQGRIVARVTNGGIDVDGLNAAPSESNTRRRYEATLNGGNGPTISVETTNGGISIKGT